MWFERRSSTDRATAGSHYPELDGLRGLAIAQILVYHYFTVLLANAPAQSVLAYAQAASKFCWAGVDLFFVISGFLVTTVLRRDLMGQRPAMAFYTRRAFRILPLYFLSLGIAGLLAQSSWAPPVLTVDNYPWWSYFLLLQNFELAATGSFGGLWLAPTWSLAIEEQFYLILPVMFLFARQRTLLVVCCVLILAAPMLRAVHEFPASYSLPYCRADGLFFGVLLALAWESSRAREFIYCHPNLLAATTAIASIAFAACALRFSSAGGVLNHLVFSIFFGLLLLTLLTRIWMPLNAIFRTRALTWLGERSYPLYLMHFGVLALSFAAFEAPLQLDSARSWSIMALALVASLAVSDVLHRVIEKPMIRRGRALSKRLSAPDSVATSPQSPVSGESVT